MCSGPDSSKRKLSPPGFSMENEFQKQKTDSCSILLELSASDDLDSFKRLVEEGEADLSAIDEPSLWYGRRIGSRKMGFERRTPLMIAATYGSVEILKYIVSKSTVDVNRSCGSDRATALHCAAAGGSSSASEIIRLLIEAAASVDSVDANGNRPGDVIAPASPTLKPKKAIEMMLKGENCGKEEDLCGIEEESQPLMEKKEYPIDLSLPDIKNGIYGTDEFRMYTFKVKPCSRAYSHDWTECPFVHPGENARRRDPRKYHYSCVPCPEFRKGTCRNGDACEYAHGVFECWLHPAQYRTRLCKDETGCTRRVCFFAHRVEELRPLYPSTGSAMPSPRSGGGGLSSLDMSAMSPLSLGSSSMLMIPTSTPPMSPSSSPLGGGVWPNQPILPTLQLPGSRLKAALNARDFELDDLMSMEMDNLSNMSGRTDHLAAALAALSGSRSGKFNHASSITPTNLDDLFGSLDPTTLSQLQGISLKPQFQSPTGANVRSNMNQQLQSGYASPTRMPASSMGLDSSMSVAAAVMNSRAAAFAKRSQSFSERGLNRPSHLGMMTTSAPMAPTMLSDWGSPNGKLDWGVQGEELHKLRKSVSFATRSNGGSVAGAAAVGLVDEPDVSWVHSLVKDGPTAGWSGSDPAGKQHQYHLNNSGAGEFHASEMLSPWAEQLYMEQEQMVA